MKRITIALLACIIVLAAGCNRGPKLNVDEERGKVQQLRKELYDKNSLLSSYDVAKEAIEKFRAFGQNFPEDSLALPFHIEAAEIAWTLGEYRLSVEIYEEIAELHPDSDSMPYVYTRLGSIYNDKLKEPETAEKYYSIVVEQYLAWSEFFPSAKFGLETLGMSEDEQFRVILRKQAEAEAKAKMAESAEQK